MEATRQENGMFTVKKENANLECQLRILYLPKISFRDEVKQGFFDKQKQREFVPKKDSTKKYILKRIYQAGEK